MRLSVPAAAFLLLATLTGCGYHSLGAATHLPEGSRSLAVPVFATRTETNHTEVALTQAVLREFATRTRLRVTPDTEASADLVLHGTILKESVTPLTYNAQTQQSSSFLVTLVVSVSLTTREGRLLYKNKNYVYREQFQSTTDLPTFLQEDPAAVDRLSRNFARALAADVLESF